MRCEEVEFLRVKFHRVAATQPGNPILIYKIIIENMGTRGKSTCKRIRKLEMSGGMER